MNRFFCKACDISGSTITIGDEGQIHHIRDVLRLKPGEKAVVCDEKKNEYNCVIREVKDKILLDILDKKVSDMKNEFMQLTIACAIPKKAKFDDMIDKLVQLGVHTVVPLKTQRVIVKLDKRKEGLRLQRWEKIALSAAKQSQRSDVAVIEPVKDFKEVIARSEGFDLKLIPHLQGARQSLKDILDKYLDKNKTGPVKIIVLIGPEGDFSEDEVRSATAAGFIPITLGKLVLRVDTAAIAVASFFRLYANR